MKKSLFTAVLSLLLLSSGAFAEEFHMMYYGQVISQTLHLKKGDIVAIDTYIPVKTCFYVIADLVMHNAETLNNFKLIATLDGVRPDRNAPFIDTVWTGAVPGCFPFCHR
jgi:hypothetical protein